MDSFAKPNASGAAALEHKAYHLPSTLDSVAEVERTAEAMAHSLGLDEDTASNVAMIAREAAINACKHGNKFAANKWVDATLTRTADTLTICIADQGQGMNPEDLPDPLDPANLLRTSGRGVFLMRAMMDEVHFRQLQPGTEVTLIKHRQSEAST